MVVFRVLFVLDVFILFVCICYSPPCFNSNFRPSVPCCGLPTCWCGALHTILGQMDGWFHGAFPARDATLHPARSHCSPALCLYACALPIYIPTDPTGARRPRRAPQPSHSLGDVPLPHSPPYHAGGRCFLTPNLPHYRR